MANINGTPGNDTALNGTGSDDIINGLAGADKIDGGAGNDVIDGGPGADIIRGGDGDDTITGGTGNDNIVGGNGRDTAIFTTGIAAASTGGTPFGSWSGAILQIVTPGEGIDTLNQVETVRFNGQDFTVTGYNKDGPYNVVANLGGDRASATDDRTPISGNVLSNDYDVDSQLQVTGARAVEDRSGLPAMPSDDPKAQDLKSGFKVAGRYGDLTLNADGTYSYEAYGKGTGIDHFQYSVTDGGVTRWVSLDITVTHVNHAPDTFSQSATGDEDSTISGQVLAKDKDGDNLTFTLGSGPTHGSLSFNSDGTYSYTPNANFSGTDGFSFTVSDGHGGSNSAHVDLYVNPVNDAPFAGDDDNSVDEDGSVSGQVYAKDIDHDALTYHVVSGPAYGSLDFHSDGTYTYTPDADFNGSDSFTFAANDGTVDSSPATVSLTVNPVNDDPTTSGASASGDEDTTISGQLTGHDVDGDDLTFSLGDGPAHGSVTVNSDGSFTYTPDADYNGSDSFGYTVSDGNGGTTTGTATINVAPVNDAPMIDEDEPVATSGGPAAFNLATDGVISFTVTGHVSANGDPQGGILHADGDAALAQLAALGISSTFLSGIGDFVGATFIDINFLGSPDGTFGWEFDFHFAGPVGTDDRVLVTSGGGIALNYVYEENTWTDGVAYGGTDPIRAQIVILDFAGDGGSSTLTVYNSHLQIRGQDFYDPGVPLFVTGRSIGGTAAPVEDTPFSGQFHAHDVDGDVLTFSLVDGHGPAHGSVSISSDGHFVYTPDANYNGSDSFEYQVSDGHGGTDTATYSFEVAAVNDAPVAAAGSVSGEEDSVITGQASANDVDGDSLTYSLVSGPSHGSLSFNSDGTYSYTPDANYHGPDSFTFKANDGTVDSNIATVSIDVDPPVNDPPVIGDPTFNGSGAMIAEDTSLSGTLQAKDVDGDDLTWSLTDDGAPAHGSVSIGSDGSFTYTPDGNYNGTDSFTYQVSDGHGGVDTDTITINVTPVNDAPHAYNGSFSGLENSVISGQASASDVDGDSLTYSLRIPKAPGGADALPLPGIEHGELEFHSDGTFIYTPDHGFAGTETFTYYVDDGHGGITSAEITLTVEDHNYEPEAHDGKEKVSEDGSLSGHVSADDEDGDELSFKLETGPAHGSISFHSDGSYTYIPNANYNGSDGFDFSVSDGNGGVDHGHVDISVYPVNDAPSIEAPKTGRTDEDHVISGQALAKDIDGDTLTFELVGGGIDGLTFNSDGSWSFDPTKVYQNLDNGQAAMPSFSYRAYDGHAYSQAVTQSLLITGVNEVINGTAGKDAITGSGIGDYVDGLGADDTIKAGGGNDQVFGGEGNDKLYGGDGDDSVSGGDDNDIVKGGAGNDSVYGDAGNDDVQGGAGDDFVYGGTGADRLSGGAGADHFVFYDGDLGSSLATTDTVTDFKAIQGDVLDFSSIDADVGVSGDQAFSVVGSFGNHAGEMTIAFNAGINATVVSMDTNGDGVADYMLQLTGNVTSTSGWLL